jgi:exonuclease III
MSTAEDITLRIGWWNTSLRDSEVKAEHFEAACGVLTNLRRLELVDVFLLGETAQAHLGGLKRHLQNLRPGVQWRQKISPRHNEVKISVLYDASKVDVGALRLDAPIVEGSVLARQTSTRLRVEGMPEIHLVIAHWPSRLHDAQQNVKRNRLGEAVRGMFRSLVARSSPEAPYLVIMGDFNDEPFDRSIAEQINSTRDRELARRKPREFLYNASWRHLGEATPHPGDPSSPSGAGTYFYRRGGPFTRWYTFDQVLVSASFLTAPGWQLDESLTGPFRLPQLVSSIMNPSVPSDHLPVVATLRHPASAS